MTPNEIACAMAVIGAHLNMSPKDLAQRVFGVTQETFGNWRRGSYEPPRCTQAVLRMLQSAIESKDQKLTVAILAALGADYE